MRSTTREDGAETTERRTVVEQVLYGEADPRLRATWRVLFSLAVFVGLVVLGETILSATEVPPVITELKLPYLAAVAGAVVVAVRLGDRSASGVGFGVNVAWLRDLAAGVGMDVIESKDNTCVLRRRMNPTTATRFIVDGTT